MSRAPRYLIDWFQKCCMFGFSRYLHVNQLSGPIPINIGNLGGLQILWVFLIQWTWSSLRHLPAASYWVEEGSCSSSLDTRVPRKEDTIHHEPFNASTVSILGKGGAQHVNSTEYSKNECHHAPMLWLVVLLVCAKKSETPRWDIELLHIFIWYVHLHQRTWILAIRYMFNNQLSGAIPDSIGNLTSLQYLWAPLCVMEWGYHKAC